MDGSSFDLISQFPDLEEFEGQPIGLVSDDLKIKGIELYPEADGQRVVVSIAITPTRGRPNLEIVILAPDGKTVAKTLLIESRSAQVVTMHLRPPDPSLAYTVKAGLFLEEKLLDSCETELTWPQ
jgi:hypothetical protein